MIGSTFVGFLIKDVASREKKTNARIAVERQYVHTLESETNAKTVGEVIQNVNTVERKQNARTAGEDLFVSTKYNA